MSLRDFSNQYLQILKGPLEGLNLTRILDEEDFFHKQILDSVEPYNHSQIFSQSITKHRLVLDIGFGGGFPLLPLAYVLPGISFVGIDARKKKVEAVNQIASLLGLKNVKAHHYRVEDVTIDKPVTITFKAVGQVGDFLPLIHSTTKEIEVYFYKGPSFFEQESQGVEKIKQSWELIENKEIIIPNTEKRLLIGFKPKIVPRGTGKSLVKLSDLL